MINRRQQGGFWGQIIGAAVGLIGGIASDRSSRRAEDRANAFTDREIRLAENNDRRAGILFNNYQNNYMPKEREFLEDSFDGESAGLEEARATADTRQEFNTQRGIIGRRMRRNGVNPASGVYAEQDRLMSLDEAKTAVGARYNARQGVDDKNYQRQYTSLALGRNLPSTAGTLTSSALGTFGRASAQSEGRANRYAADAASNFSAAGSSIGGIIDALTQKE